VYILESLPLYILLKIITLIYLELQYPDIFWTYLKVQQIPSCLLKLAKEIKKNFPNVLNMLKREHKNVGNINTVIRFIAIHNYLFSKIFLKKISTVKTKNVKKRCVFSKRRSSSN